LPDGQVLKRQALIVGALAGVFLIADLVVSGISFYTDLLWFESLGYRGVFVTVLTARIGAFGVGFLAFLIPAVASVLIARSLGRRRGGGGVSIREDDGVAYIVQLDQESPRKIVSTIALIAALGLSVVMGLWAAGQWENILRFLNAQSFGIADPLHGQDVGFYFFTLPIYQFLQGWLFWALLAILVLTLAVYMVGFQENQVTLDPGIFGTNRGAKVHVMLIAAAAALVMAVSYRIQIWDLVYSTGGAAFGAGYADATARQTALWVMMGVLVVTAILFMVSAFRRGFALPMVGVGLWVVVAVLLGGVYPALVQTFIVQPSQLERERPFIEATIDMTRKSFALDRVEVQEFDAADAVTLESINANPDTINNIRLWDHRPLRETFRQLQAIRLYYDFHDVDVARYTIDGRYRQVMLSARELSPEQLAVQAQNWVTRRLQFTHGYGVVMAPVTEIIGEGLPEFLIRDVPPRGAIPIDRPEIYYGEKIGEYVIVKTTAQEFNYPLGDENVYGTYEGEGGVVLNSFIRKLAYAAYFRDGNIMFTQYLTPESSVLYHRNIQERVQKIAPFLMLDHDPYISIADGKLYWIQDAYTYSSAYPYSEPYREFQQVATEPGLAAAQQVRTGRTFNYIRNSVKVVIDAYEGSVQFYVAEPDDPMVLAYSAIFPEMFTSMDEMPDSIRSQIRYPEGIFKAQATMYQTYHMTDPQVFFNREDLWAIPDEIFAGNRQSVEPYFTIMKLPGEEQEEFLQMLPFSPSNRDNMIAWLAARSDGDNYGRLLVYRYPKDRLIYGPMQVEARINQVPAIAEQFTLWSQAGSQVNRGNLLVIPVGGANLYVEPVFLQADRGSIPELKRVIVATGDRTVMEPTLADALNVLYGGQIASGIGGQVVATQPGAGAQPPAAPAGEQPPAAAQPPADGQPAAAQPAASPQFTELVRAAQGHYDRAQERLRGGDLAGFGEELKRLEETLAALDSQVQ
jgi:uncharacterized protein